MTTIVAFAPPTFAPFQFTLLLDGVQYTATVTWNTAGQRWYVNVFSNAGGLLFSLPLLGSQTPQQLLSLFWENGIAFAQTEAPHGYKFLDTVDLTVAGCIPDGYNGKQRSFITGVDTFQFPLQQNPGPAFNDTQQIISLGALSTASVLGVVSLDLNIAAGYTQTSTLIFRDDSQTFEVSP